MHMKKLLLTALAAVLALNLAACSTPSDNEPVGNDTDNEQVEETLGKYSNGTYTGVSDGDEKGYAKATITIEDDKIVNVELTQTNSFGDEKGEDYAYEAYHEAKVAMAEKFVEANGVEVDSFTGATGSSTQWKQAVERALALASTEGMEGKYFDGTFMAASEADDKGRGVALVTIKDDVITEVVLKQTTFADEKEAFKDEDYAYEAFHEAQTAMAEAFVEANGTDVDSFTGATGSSSQWKEAVENALANAAIQ
ncbi:FMN-binding protein [Alkaliphilus crotonatoxidans]